MGPTECEVHGQILINAHKAADFYLTLVLPTDPPMHRRYAGRFGLLLIGRRYIVYTYAPLNSKPMHDPKPQGITHPDVTTAEGITVTSPTNCYTHAHTQHNPWPLTLTEPISSTPPFEDPAGHSDNSCCMRTQT